MAPVAPLSLKHLVLLLATSPLCNSFAPTQTKTTGSFGTSYSTRLYSDVAEIKKVDERTGKPTGTSFLPAETIERAKKGNPIEKTKIQKDGTSAFRDIYEYAAAIRAGETSWEEIEKADMDSVSMIIILYSLCFPAITFYKYLC